MTTPSNPDGPQRVAGGMQCPRFWSLLVRAALPIGILAVGGVAYWVLAAETEEAASPPAEEQAIRTKVIELHVGDYPVVIKTHGVVQPHNEVTLSAQVSGQITRITPEFEVGSYFSTGDVLVELDERDYVNAGAVADARRLVAESVLQLAVQDHERILKLFDKSVISEAQVHLALATRAQAEAELDSAVAQVEQAKRDRDRTKIRAPFDGRVRRKAVGLGQSVGIGTALGVVFAVDFAEVRLPIAGRDLQFLDLPELAGDPPVDVTLRNAIRDTSSTVWRAKIVRTEGTLDEDSLELFAIARVDDPFGRTSGNAPLRIGQPVVGLIAGKVLTHVVAVPRVAVRQLDQVFLVDKTEHRLTAKTIVPIWSDEKYIIIQDPSIEDGMLLSTSHIVFGPNGAKVEIVPDVEVGATAAKTKKNRESEPVAN